MGNDEQAELEAFLSARDAPCPVCEYNLRALKSDHCPECGRHLVLAVGTTEPKLGAFVLGVVGFSGGLGFCGLLLVYAVVWIMLGQMTIPQKDLLTLAAGTGASGLGLWLWLRHRRRVGRLSDEVRWAMAAACVAVGLVGPVWFILTVR